MVFELNDVCILDKNGSMRIATNKIVYVKIVKVNKGIFNTNYDGVICDEKGKVVGTPTTLNCIHPDNLRKLNPNEVVVIRYPDDVPIIKSEELEALLTMIDSIQALDTNKCDKKTFGIVNKLVLKLQLFTTLIHEY